MNGLIFDIKKFAMHDGPGVRTTVFFKGCTLRCLWCHNPEGRLPYSSTINTEKKLNGKTYIKEEVIGFENSVEELIEEILKEKVIMEESGGGVTFSGGEPLLQHEFLHLILDRCKDEGIHTAIDTTGYTEKDILVSIADKVDLILYDLKHSDAEKHLNVTGVSNRRIIENLTILLENGNRIWLRIPIIPGFNHTKKDMKNILTILEELPDGIEQINLLPYHRIATEKYKRLDFENHMVNIPSISNNEVKRYVRLFERAGFKTYCGG